MFQPSAVGSAATTRVLHESARVEWQPREANDASSTALAATPRQLAIAERTSSGDCQCKPNENHRPSPSAAPRLRFQSARAVRKEAGLVFGLGWVSAQPVLWPESQSRLLRSARFHWQFAELPELGARPGLEYLA